VRDGSYATEQYYGGMGDPEKMVALAPLSPLAEGSQPIVDEFEKAFLDKKWDPFCGPVIGQNGVIAVGSDRCLTDQELLSMDWFVLGVKGEAPAPAKEGNGVVDVRAHQKPR